MPDPQAASFDPGRADDLTAADRATEALFASLRPAADAGPEVIHRLLFRAGQAAGEMSARRSARRQLLAWRAAAAVLVGGLGVSLWWCPQPTVRVVYQDRPAAVETARETVSAPPPPVVSPPAPPLHEASLFAVATPPNRPLLPSADSNYLVLRDAVLQWGVGVMPQSRGTGTAAEAKPPTVESLLGEPPVAEKPRRGVQWKNFFFFGDHL